MSIKKSQAILKCFIGLKSVQSVSSLVFGLRCAQKKKPCFVTLRTSFRSTAGGQDCQTLNDRQSTLLAESLRSFLDKSGKGKAEREKGKEERGKLEKVVSVTKHGFVF